MTMKPYAQYKNDGTLWRAGRSIIGLCAAWNHATNPALLMTDADHDRSRIYARAVMARMCRLGFVFGRDYRELSNGMLWPMAR
jgi:hypothetical protein